MPRRINVLFAVLMLFANIDALAQDFASDDLALTDIDKDSFTCAEELLPSIDILGRGQNFPQFLIEDVFAELRRQDTDVKLLKIKCSGEPKITGVFAEIEENGETLSALDKLNVIFDLEMLVDTGTAVWLMHVDQGYFVSELTSASPKVIQKFDVIETLNEDGSPLKGKTIQVLPSQ